VLIHNAGMMQEEAIEELSLDDLQRNLNVNLTGPFLMIRAALPYLPSLSSGWRQDCQVEPALNKWLQ
jgi:NAD(P)-dependent dehydrogenase (short-subunit alcohol dehydrogenase family)